MEISHTDALGVSYNVAQPFEAGTAVVNIQLIILSSEVWILSQDLGLVWFPCKPSWVKSFSSLLIFTRCSNTLKFR